MVNGNNNSGQFLNYKWAFGVLLTIMGTMLFLAFGMLQAVLNNIDGKLSHEDAAIQDLYMRDYTRKTDMDVSKQDFEDLVSRMDKIEGEIAILQAAAIPNSTDVGKLQTQMETSLAHMAQIQHEIDIQQLWISAHIHADKAQRELHNGK